MKKSPLIRSLVSRVTNRLSPETARPKSDVQESRPLLIEALEPRILFSGSPAPAPTPESAPTAQEAPAPAPADASTETSAPPAAETTVATQPEASTDSSAPEAADPAADIAATDQGITAIALTDAEVAAVASAAAQRWESAGLTAEQSATLAEVSYQILDLEDGRLAAAEGNMISIDRDAAGRGWFVDSTPLADEEFESGAGLGEAASGVDLLTAILHEQGHILGVPDVTSTMDDVMEEFLGAGERRLPTASQASDAVLGSSDSTEYLTIRGTGAANLIGNDLTDLGNDGNEGAYVGVGNTAGFDAVFFASTEAAFGGGENSFNVFDNQVGGGNAKSCCQPAPVTIGADFSTTLATGETLITLTGFTLTSSNDSPGRDPLDFEIQGSTDTTTGLDGTWTTIYDHPTGTDFTARNQVISYSVAEGDTFLTYDGFKAFRLVTNTVQSGTAFALGELEFFGVAAVADTGAATENGAPVIIDVLANDIEDPSGILLAGVTPTSAKGAAVTINPGASPTVSYDPNSTLAFESLAAGETTTDTFTYSVTSGEGMLLRTFAGPNNLAALDAALAAGTTPNGSGIIALADLQEDNNGSEKFAIDNPFPGVSGNNYGAVLTGTLVVDVAGVYTFGTFSDDASRILIDLDQDGDLSDETAVVTQTGCCHHEIGSAVTLAIGTYNFQAAFTEIGGGSYAEFYYTKGDFSAYNTSGSGTVNFDNATTNGANFVLVGDSSEGIATFQTSTATVTVTVTGVNDAPVASDDTGYTTAEDTVLNVPTAGTTTQPAASLVLAQDPLLYYRMDETGGTTADNQGNLGAAADGTLIGDTAPGSIGQVNGAFAFDGNGDYISTGATASQLGIQGSFTASAWVNPDATNGDRTIFGTDQTGGNQGLHLIIRAGKAHFGFFGNDTGGVATIPTGEWTHLTWVYDSAAQTQSIYVNGALDNSTGGHGAFTGNDTINVGRWAGSRYFDGLIDEAAIVGGVLTATEIADIYNAGHNDGLLANDTDPDFNGSQPNDTLTVTGVSGGGIGSAVTLTSGATVTGQADGSFAYDPNGAFEYLAVGETATDTFTYTVSDSGARFVQIIESTTSTFHLSELEVFEAGVTPDNAGGASFGGLSTSNNDIAGGVPYNIGNVFPAVGTTAAVQHGNVNNQTNNALENAGAVWSTNIGTQNSQFTLDLGDTFDIGQLRAWPRADGCCTERWDALTINLYADDGTGNPGALVRSIEVADPGGNIPHDITIDGGTDTATATVTITGVNDSPTAVDDNYTSDEDTVFVVPTLPLENLALGGTASQSSTGFGGVASRANDGNTNGAYGGGSVTHTNNATYSYWQVELDQPADIEQIVLHNRTDGCCVSRLAQFRVSVFDGDPDNGGREVFSVNEPGAPGTAPYVIDVASLDPNVHGNFIRVAIDPASAAGDAGMDGDGVNPAGGTLSLAEVQVFGFNGLLANDTDPDANDTLQVVRFDATSVGGATVNVDPGGTFTYDPTATTAIQALDDGDVLADSFTYTITDNNRDGKIRTVGIDVGAGGSDSQISNLTEAEAIYAAALAAGFDFAGGQSGLVTAGASTYNITSSGEELDDRVDYAGTTNRDFTPNENYPGVTSAEDFLLHSEWSMLLKAGTYTVYGDGDDGFSLKLSGVTFTNKFGSGAGQGAANEIRFENPTGSANTGGTFTLAVDTVVDAEMTWFERGGGDFFELAIQSGTTTNGTPDGSYQIIADGVLGMLIASDASQFSTATANVTVNGLNDAPMLSGANDFDGVAVNDPENDGNLVSELTGTITDIDDSASIGGIAVTGTTVSDAINAKFQYSTDGGTIWNDVGVVGANSALLLLPTDRIRLSPTGAVQVTGSIDFKAWDQTGTTAGLEHTKVDSVPDGGTSPFSTFVGISNVQTVNVTIENGVLQYGEEEGRNDMVTIWSDGTSVFIHDDNGPVTTDDGTQIDPNTVSVLLSPLWEDLEFKGNDLDDTITVGDMTGFDGSLTIDGEDGFDSVIFSSGMTLALGTGVIDGTDENLDVDAETFFANLGATVSVVGTGTIDIDATGGTGDFMGIQLKRASLTSDAGDITLDGAGGDTGNTNDGVHLSHGSSITTTGGSVAITGTATAPDGANDGVTLLGSSDITTGTGNIDITGTSSGGSYGIGVQLFTGTELTTAGGNVTLVGTSVSTGSGNSGIYTNGATVTAAGAGTVALSGTGSGAGGSNIGLRLTKTTIGADSGAVVLTGSGGGGTKSNEGVQIGVATSVSSASGDVTVTGTGNGSTTKNSGVTLLSGADVSGNNVTVTGSGGNGTSVNYGVSLSSASISAANDLTVTGTGNGSANYNRGIYATKSAIVAGADANVTGNGSATAGGKYNDGVYLKTVTLTADTLALTGNSGTGSSNNRGVYVYGSTVTGGTSFNIAGTSNGAAGTGNTGVSMAYSSLSDTGTITGDGGGAGRPNYGVYMHGITTGLDPVNVTGTAVESEDDTYGNFFPAILPLLMAEADRRAQKAAGRVRRHGKDEDEIGEGLNSLFARLRELGGTGRFETGKTPVFRSLDGHIVLDPIFIENGLLDDALTTLGIEAPEVPAGTRRTVLLTGEDHGSLAGFVAFADEDGELVVSQPLHSDLEHSSAITVGEFLQVLEEAAADQMPSWSNRIPEAARRTQVFGNSPSPFADALGLL